MPHINEHCYRYGILVPYRNENNPCQHVEWQLKVLVVLDFVSLFCIPDGNMKTVKTLTKRWQIKHHSNII